MMYLIPIAMDVGGTEGKAVMHQGGIDGQALLGAAQELVQVG